MVDVESMERYKPSGVCTAKAVAVMIGLGLGGTIPACLVMNIIGQLVYVGLLFAILLGLAAGMSVLAGVRIGKCRRPLVAAIIGVGVALSGYVLLHYLNYASHARSWGERAFLGYLIEWRSGISRVFWLLEIGLAAGLGGWIPYAATYEPFCEPCGNWCERGRILVAPIESCDTVLDACTPGNAARIKEIATSGTSMGRCVVDLDYCALCKTTGFLTVTTVEEAGGGRSLEQVVLAEAVVSGSHVAEIIPDAKASEAAAEPPERIREDEIPEPETASEETESIASYIPETPRHEEDAKEKDTGDPREGASEVSKKDGPDDG